MTSSIQKIKVCLVGAGAWGRQHARVFSQRPDVELCAVAGRTLEKTQARASEFGRPRLCLFQGASCDRTKFNVRSLRENPSVLPAPRASSNQADFYFLNARSHCSIMTFPVSHPKRNASNAC